MVAVGYGFHPYEFLLKFAPNYCIRDESELINLLNMLYVKANVKNKKRRLIL